MSTPQDREALAKLLYHAGSFEDEIETLWLAPHHGIPENWLRVADYILTHYTPKPEPFKTPSWQEAMTTKIAADLLSSEGDGRTEGGSARDKQEAAPTTDSALAGGAPSSPLPTCPECLEQARLNGMGAEREAALIARAVRAERELAVAKHMIFQRERFYSTNINELEREISRLCRALRAIHDIAEPQHCLRCEAILTVAASAQKPTTS